MRRRRFVVAFVLVLMVAATGCARKSSEAVSALPLPEGSAAVSTPGLDGTWRGTFGQVMTGDSGEVKGDIIFEINPDGTYKGSWNTHLVAGSRRASPTDPATKRVSVAVELHRAGPAPEAP